MVKGRRFGGLGVAVATLVAGVAGFVPSSPAQAEVVGVQARPADALVESIGVNTHLHYGGSVYKDLASVERVLVEAGIRHIRDYPVNMPAIAQLARRGVRTSAMIAHQDQGSWALSPDASFSNIKTAPQAFSSIEGTNEPDITMGSDWPSKMRTHQRMVWDRVKGDPSLQHLPVAGPSMTWERNASALGDISSSVDWGNVHPYPGGRSPDKRVSEDVAAAKRYNVAGKPVIATETGYHTAVRSSSGHRAASEAAQATYMPRLSLGYFAMGVPRAFSYELVDQGADQTQSEETFGLVRRDFSPKPAYTATKNLIALLSDPGAAFTPGRLAYDLVGTDDATREVVLQKRDGTFWLAVWQETSVWDEVNFRTLNPPDRNLTVDLGTSSDVRTYQPNQGSGPRSTHGGTRSVSFTSSEQVTLLEIRNGTAPTTTTPPTTPPTTSVPVTTPTTTAPAPTTTTTTAPPVAAVNLLSADSSSIDQAIVAADHRWVRRSSGSTTPAPAITTAGSEVLHGTKSMVQRKDGSAAAPWDAWQSQQGGGRGVPVRAGTVYTFRADLRLPDAPSSVAGSVEWFDASGRLLNGAIVGAKVPVGQTGSTGVAVTGTAPAGAVEARLIHRVTSMAANSRLIGDRFSLHAGTSTGFPGAVTTPTTTAPAPTTTTTAPTTTTTAPPVAAVNLLSAASSSIDQANVAADHRWVRRSSGSTTPAPAITTAGSEVLHGSKSVVQRKDGSAAAPWDAWQSQQGGGRGVPVRAGTAYTFRADLRLPDAPSSVAASVEWFDASGRLLNGAVVGAKVPVGQTGSTGVAVTGTAPPGAVEARLIHRVTSMAANSRLIGDRFSFHPGTNTGFPVG